MKETCASIMLELLLLAAYRHRAYGTKVQPPLVKNTDSVRKQRSSIQERFYYCVFIGGLFSFLQGTVLYGNTHPLMSLNCIDVF